MHPAAVRLPSLVRRAAAIASLAGFLSAIVGVPVLHPFLGPGGKDVSRPFPCMHSGCGCDTAEACWRGCCCHTNRQKLAWAKANGVDPPDYVLAAAEKEPLAASRVACCTDCADQRDTVNCCTTAAHGDVADGDGLALELLPGVAARECQGLPKLWLLLSAAMPIAPRFECQLGDLEIGHVSMFSDTAMSRGLMPATPPPRA